ncbi:hypothetical protein F4859DRAFT_175762 [Xylaria cf. heliscus]|nr:hypothetical protein F4859DRAFT_175762 [Xylaria cf. heliscus]
MLKVFHRRCHPDPERALSGFYWKGRDLHSQRRYLALRLRFRREEYGYLIAHDVHDAIKEFRKRTHRREKDAKKQRKKAKKISNKPTPESPRTPAAQSSLPTPSHVQFQDTGSNKRRAKAQKARKEQVAHINNNREPDTPHLTGEAQPQTVETKTAKVKRRFRNIFITRIPRSTSAKTMAIAPPVGEDDSFQDPFRDPSPGRRKKNKARKKARKQKKMAASLELLNNSQDPFRDPSPMRLVDAEDFRL